MRSSVTRELCARHFGNSEVELQVAVLLCLYFVILSLLTKVMTSQVWMYYKTSALMSTSSPVCQKSSSENNATRKYRIWSTEKNIANNDRITITSGKK